MSAEEIQKLVARSARHEYAWQHPVLDKMIIKHFAHVRQRLNYYRFLCHLVAWDRPAISVELGVEYGLASAHMAVSAFAYGGKVIGIDVNGKLVEEAEIQRAWPRTYTLIVGDSCDAAEMVALMVGQYGPIGVLFQDSSHHYAPSCREWDLYRPLMADDGIWVCDDVTPSFYEDGVDEKSMVAYFDERPGREKLKFPNVLHYGNTIGVILL